MQYSTLLLSFLSIATLSAQINVGDSLAHLEILHEEHFPRPPFVMYFEKDNPADASVNHEKLLSFSQKAPIFYVAVSQNPDKLSTFNQSYPVIIYDAYEGLCDEVGVEAFPTTLVIGENYVVKKVITGSVNNDCLDSNSLDS